jgi:hypothetical protein
VVEVLAVAPRVPKKQGWTPESNGREGAALEDE